MKKSASILDYSYPFLDPAVWDHEQKLYSYQKDFILRLLNSMYENYQLKQPEAWITDIRIIGSLTTSKWLFTSDMDVHMVIDLAKFIEINMPGTEPKLAFEYLDSTRKEFDRAKILAPMTQHPIEYYFEVPEFITTNTSVVGIYSITQDKWLKEPVIFPADIDFEESKKQVMTEAEALAAQLDGSFGKIDRQIKRIDELELMINAWDGDKQQLFYNKVEEKLKAIEAEILKDLELRQALIDSRHAAQDPMADIEIKFKWLQRFGFFGILTKLKALMLETGGQITVQELPLLKKIVTESELKEAFLKEALHKQTLAVDFDDTIAHENEDRSIGEPEDGVKEALTKLKEDGYVIEIYSARANDDKGADEIKQWLDAHEIPYDSILNIEKPIATHYIDNRAIKYTNWKDVVNEIQKSDKTASLIVAGLYDKYWLDPSGKEFVLNGEGHLDWVYQNMLGPSPDMSRGDIEADALEKADEMISGGWTRVTTETSGNSEFALEVGNLRKLPGYLDNFIAQHYQEGVIELDDMEGNFVQVDEPFPSLQRAVLKALRQPRVFSKLDLTAQTKKVKQGNYSCVMALVPHDLAQEIVAWGVRNVPDEDLYLDGEKFGRELESHITIKYGLLTDDGKHVRRSFNDSKPFKAKLGKVRHFEPPELPFDVLTIEVISDDLQKANAMICDKFDCAEGLVSDEYKPHITIAYMKRGDAKEYVGADEFEGKEIVLDTVIFSPNKGNRTYFSIGTDKESSLILEKTADFLPSLFNAPDNDWQMAEGGDDKEIALNPDSVSDDTTEYEPCTTGKPRTKEVWRQFISMFSNLFSPKDTRKIESYDKELEETEKNELGEDQTALEYAKDFKDLNLVKKPHNTTWDSLTQDGEPSKPTSVTYSPQISNEDNLDQNSPGGFPRRFMGKPKGEWFSNEGEANHILIDMLKNRSAAIEKMTIDVTAGSQSASVPDYLIDEWKTDQLHDDISEEPYVNHDQRDYPYGMHDSPENTGYNIGWPKDNTRAVVRLDTLENPAFRLDPFGIGEYNVTYYTGMPASDGIEQMNEE